MKLEKITERLPRSYEDACGTAAALDLIGERWAMLVMRELMMGPRRFGDLRASLPGISANVLTQRLEGLEAGGIVLRKRLPPPAAVQVYELTDWGREAEPIILSLGRWGARSPLHDPSLPLSGVSMMLSFRAMFNPVRAAGVDVSIAFHFGAEIFDVSVRDRSLICERGRPDKADVEVSGSPSAVAGMVYGFVSLPESEATGALTVKGDRGALARFAEIFELPGKVGV